MKKYNRRHSVLLLNVLRLVMVLAMLNMPSAGHAQEPISGVAHIEVSANTLADGQFMYGPNVKDFELMTQTATPLTMFTGQGFAIEIPDGWSFQVGNEFGPHLPVDTVTLGDTTEPFSVSIVSVALSNDFPSEVTEFAQTILRTYRAALPEWGIPTQSSKATIPTSIRTVHQEPDLSIDGEVFVVSEFIVALGRGYWLSTEFYADSATELPRTPREQMRIRNFEQIVSSFTVLVEDTAPITTFGLQDWQQAESLTQDTIQSSADDSLFTWPSSGYIGWIYAPSTHNGIDIWTSRNCDDRSTNRGNPVYSAGTGTLDYIYKIPGGVYDGVRIRHENVWTHYWHLGSLNPDTRQQASFVTAGIGAVNWQSQIGYQGNLMRNGNMGAVQLTCIHLHVTVANGSADSNHIDPSPYFDAKLNKNNPPYVSWHFYVERSQSSTPPPPSCPSDRNGIILYQHWNFNCGNEGEGRGYVRRNDSGLQNVGGDFNDKASSIRVPSGWSVKLFQDSDGRGGWACRTSDDDNFSDDNRFDNGVRINDNVSSFQVFKDSRCGGTINQSPRKPTLNRPANGYVSPEGRIPELCWNNNGDPDNDSVEFYVEITGGNRTASKWTRDTCWTPGELTGQYTNFQWRVKAKDTYGAESGWSDETRSFRIEAPNPPPIISFDTANGNGDSRITTREQTWTFRGTASDPNPGSAFSRVEFRCNDCDNPGSGQSSSTSTSWSITRNGMSGRNYVYFEAFDDRQGARSAKTLELNIDLAVPTTDIQINGKSPDGWPTWFNEPAQVRLTGRDNGTGRAVADVREVRYRRDGGGEQVQSGATVNFTESSDGEHTVRYYAVDNVGNVESERTATYRVDRTPPAGISGLQESNGVVSNQWQKNQNKPTFTWNASTDAHSGLGGYQFYFGADANGTAVHFDVAANAVHTLTPNNVGVATGTYHLRGRTWDKAGNTSNWQTLFVFRYDGTPPPNPGQAIHINGPKNDTWQKITAQANFTWTVPVDEGSGIKGYLSYWGTDPNGESANLLTTNGLQSAQPLCTQGEACTGYLRLRSQDNVDLTAEKWSTTFVLRYDGAPPVADFTVNGGVTQTAQTLMTLDLKATDLGSGLREMRFSSDGTNWTNWESYAESRPWEVPAISRQSWPIYLQVKDAVGWESAVISRTVYFDVNVDQPRSDNYRLFNYVQVAGAGAHTSQPSGYQGHSTVGQVHDSPRITSTSYSLASGYEAGSRAIPLVVPGHDEFEFINGIFASGVVNSTMQSGQYRLIGVWGEPALPNNRTEIASSSYRLQPGFLAARPSAQGTPIPTDTPTPGPTPTPTPTPACEFPRVSINDGGVFATSTSVNLSLCAPNVTEMMVSNDGGFAGAVWEPYARNKAWTLTSHSNYVLPRFVYVAFRDAKGQIYATYLDDIILDPTPPEAKVRVGSNLPLDETALLSARTAREGNAIFHAQGVSYLWSVEGRWLDEPLPIIAAGADSAIDLYLSARDQVGNVTGMQVSDNGIFGDSWESYSAQKSWTPEGGDGVKTVYARFRDEAGNASTPYTATFALDTQPPIGGIALSHPIIGPDVVTTTVWLGAEDNLSGVADMRLSTDPTFADAVWRPFAATSTWVYSQVDRSRSALYVQFRDHVGNESEVLNAPLWVDNMPPLVYVEVEEGETLTRTVRVYSYDELTYPDQMRLTNDPLFLDAVVTQPYSETVTWTFDNRHVVWVQIKDAVGNWTEAWPAYDGTVLTPVAPENKLFLPSVLSLSAVQNAGNAAAEVEIVAPEEEIWIKKWETFLPAIGD